MYVRGEARNRVALTRAAIKGQLWRPRLGFISRRNLPRARANKKGGRGAGGGAEMSERKRGAGTRKDEVVTREYTINLHKRLHGW